MNKMMIAAVSVMGTFAAFAAAEQEVGEQNWRVTVGGVARGSMKGKVGNFSERCEAYGADLDIQYKTFSSGDFNLWTGIGGSYIPEQRVSKASFYEIDNSDPDVTIEDGGRGSLDIAYGELRLLLVPEWQITKRWAVGARAGVAFDWVRATIKTSTWSLTNIHIPGLPEAIIPVGPDGETDHMTDFVAQAIMGVQTTYMFCDNLGLYANFDYRCGGSADFEKNGQKYGELNMNGWFAGAGVVVQF